MFGQHVASSDLFLNSDAPEAKLIQAAVSSPIKGELETRGAHQYISTMDCFLEYEYAYYKATQPNHLEYHNKLQKSSPPTTKLRLNHPWSLNIVDPSSPQCPEVKQKRYEEILANKIAAKNEAKLNHDKKSNHPTTPVEDNRTYNELMTLINANDDITNMPGLVLLSDILRELSSQEIPLPAAKKTANKLPSWELLLASCDKSELHSLNGLNLVQYVLSLLEPELYGNKAYPVLSSKTSTESPIKQLRKEEPNKNQFESPNPILNDPPTDNLPTPFNIDTYKNISLLYQVTSSPSNINQLPNLQVFCQWFGESSEPPQLSQPSPTNNYPTYHNISLLSQVCQTQENELPNLQHFCNWFSPAHETQSPPSKPSTNTNDPSTTNVTPPTTTTSISSLTNSITATLPTLRILLTEFADNFSGLQKFNQLLTLNPNKSSHKLAISKLIDAAPLNYRTPCLNFLLIAYNNNVLNPPQPAPSTITQTTEVHTKPIVPLPSTNNSSPKPTLPEKKLLDIESEPPPLPPPAHTNAYGESYESKFPSVTSSGNLIQQPPMPSQEEKPNRRLFFDENTPENLLLKSTLLQPLKLDNYEESQEELDCMQTMDSFLEYEYVYYKATQKSRNTTPVSSPSPKHPVKPKVVNTTTPTVNCVRLHHPWSLNSPFVEKKRKEIRLASRYSNSL